MIELNIYRQRIGSFIINTGQIRTKIFSKVRKKTRLVNYGILSQKSTKCKETLLNFMCIVLVQWLSECIFFMEKTNILIACLQEEYIPLFYLHTESQINTAVLLNYFDQNNYRMKNPNFMARYTNGNKKSEIKGIRNIHLNIRSLTNKVFEIKKMSKVSVSV